MVRFRYNIFTSTSDTAIYRNIIMQFIAMLTPEEHWWYLQEDGVTAHTATETINFLFLFFDNWLISKGLWPPKKSRPDSSGLFFWSHLKNKVFESGVPASLDDLCAKIKEETEQIIPNNFNTYSTILLNEWDYAEMLEEIIFNNLCNLSFININSVLFIVCFFLCIVTWVVFEIGYPVIVKRLLVTNHTAAVSNIF